MAISSVNLTKRIEFDVNIQQINTSLSSAIQTKANIILDYAQYLNSTWGGFNDEIGCPENITLSWSIAESFDTILRYDWWQIFCESDNLYGWFPFQVYFNDNYDDTEFLEFEGAQILFNSANRVWILNSFEEIFVDGNLSFPLQPDGIDDNFDSDNYMISSTWSILDYPDWYIDNDANHRIHNFWYILPWDDWFNIFWSNQKIIEYIASNSNNIPPILNLSEVLQWVVYLDINWPFDLRIVRFDRLSFNQLNQLIILEDTTMSSSSSWSWFIQSDGVLIDSDISDFILSWSEYEFDFLNNDYAIFIRNTWIDNTLTYQVMLRDISWGKVYFVPVSDDTESSISFLGSHIIFSENGIPIWEMQEIIWSK